MMISGRLPSWRIVISQGRLLPAHIRKTLRKTTFVLKFCKMASICNSQCSGSDVCNRCLEHFTKNDVVLKTDAEKVVAEEKFKCAICKVITSENDDIDDLCDNCVGQLIDEAEAKIDEAEAKKTLTPVQLKARANLVMAIIEYGQTLLKIFRNLGCSEEDVQKAGMDLVTNVINIAEEAKQRLDDFKEVQKWRDNNAYDYARKILEAIPVDAEREFIKLPEWRSNSATNDYTIKVKGLPVYQVSYFKTNTLWRIACLVGLDSNGKRDGFYQYFNNNGKLLEETLYSHGKKNGVSHVWTVEWYNYYRLSSNFLKMRDLYEKKIYKMDKKVETWLLFANGQPVADKVYINNKRHMELEVYQ